MNDPRSYKNLKKHTKAQLKSWTLTCKKGEPIQQKIEIDIPKQEGIRPDFMYIDEGTDHEQRIILKPRANSKPNQAKIKRIESAFDKAITEEKLDLRVKDEDNFKPNSIYSQLLVYGNIHRSTNMASQRWGMIIPETQYYSNQTTLYSSMTPSDIINDANTFANHWLSLPFEHPSWNLWDWLKQIGREWQQWINDHKTCLQCQHCYWIVFTNLSPYFVTPEINLCWLCDYINNNFCYFPKHCSKQLLFTDCPEDFPTIPCRDHEVIL